jgi:uncharacterized protein (TIGR03067 family)
MRLLPLAVLAFSLPLVAPAARAADDKADDAKQLQGTWVVDQAMYKDEKDAEVVKQMKAVRVVFDGDTLTLRHPPGNEEKGGFTLDPSKKPKQIDLGDNAKGIYELDGDTLKLCWDADAKTNGRPTKFAADRTKDRVTNLILIREAKK